jgi:hypothetical protein
MKAMSEAGRLALVLSVIILTGCRNSSANITSSSMAAAPIVPKRLLVFADIGKVMKNKHDGDEEDIFSAEFTSALGRCGVTASYLKKRPIDDHLTLDDGAKQRDDRGLASNSFPADAILDIQWTRQTTGTNAPPSADYSLSLLDLKSKQQVWKGQMRFVSAWYGGQRFAATLVDRLKQDGFIPASCIPPAVPKA